MYIESGYVETGYFEGDFSIPDIPKAKLKFFISKGELSEAEEIEQVKSSLGENEIGVFYVPSQKKFSLVTNESFIDFVTNSLDMGAIEDGLKNSDTFNYFLDGKIQNGVDLDYLTNQLLASENFINSVASSVADKLEVSVSMVAPDGTILANPEVTRDGATFTFDVPEELLGIQYGVSITFEGA